MTGAQVDWEPPGGLQKVKSSSASRRGGVPNPIGFPVWLGEVGRSDPAYVATETVDVGETRGRSGCESIGSLADLPARWWIEAVSDVGGYQWVTTMSITPGRLLAR